jgi:hypothetical protein
LSPVNISSKFCRFTGVFGSQSIHLRRQKHCSKPTGPFPQESSNKAQHPNVVLETMPALMASFEQLVGDHSGADGVRRAARRWIRDHICICGIQPFLCLNAMKCFCFYVGKSKIREEKTNELVFWAVKTKERSFLSPLDIVLSTTRSYPIQVTHFVYRYSTTLLSPVF